MKKLLCVFIVVLMLVGCGAPVAEVAEETPEMTQAIMSEETPTPMPTPTPTPKEIDYEKIGDETMRGLMAGTGNLLSQHKFAYDTDKKQLVCRVLLNFNDVNDADLEQQVKFSVALAESILFTYNSLVNLDAGNIYKESEEGYYGGFFDENDVIIGIAPHTSSLKDGNDFYIVQEIERGSHAKIMPSPLYAVLFGYDDTEEELQAPSPTLYDEAMVSGSNINMRAGASTQTEIVEKVGSDTKIEVIGEENEWYYVKANGKEGYIHKDYIVIGAVAIAAAKSATRQTHTEAPTNNKTSKPESTQNLEEEPTPKPTSTPKPTIEPTPTPKTESRRVYYTKTGKKYHYENPCGNGTYYPCTLDEALERGLSACEKCVLH